MRLFLIFCLLLGFATDISAENITVSAAISLKEALGAIAQSFEQATGNHVDFNFAGSGVLAAQIRQGAPVDVFISAAEKQVDDLVAGGSVDAATKRVVAGNSLVLIVPAAAGNAVKGFADLKSSAVGKIALGRPQAVPAGEYAVQVLNHLQLMEAVTGKLVYGESVRQVLDYVSRGEVYAGMVYSTDAASAGSAVRVVAVADPAWHDPIEYPAVIVAGSGHAAVGREFIRFLGGDQARKIFIKQGFTLPATQPTTGPAR